MSLDAQPSEMADKFIGVVLILLLVISVFGNSAAFIYFWKNRHKSLPNKLYMTIIFVDLITSFSSVPIITSLFNSRKPMIFESSVVCVTYLISMNFSMRMSMFLVAVLSIARTASIVTPHRTRTVDSKVVALSIICYGTVLLGVDALFTAKKWFTAAFHPSTPACVFRLLEDNQPSDKTLTAFFILTVVIETLTPPIVVFVSFIFTLVALKKSAPRSNIDTERRLRQISITVALFTAQHLVCTLPFFIYIFSQTVVYLTGIPEIAWYHNGDMKWYGKITFIVLPSCLNTALNPCLYFWRMPRIRQNISLSMRSAYQGALESRDTNIQSMANWVNRRLSQANNRSAQH